MTFMVFSLDALILHLRYCIDDSIYVLACIRAYISDGQVHGMVYDDPSIIYEVQCRLVH